MGGGGGETQRASLPRCEYGLYYEVAAYMEGIALDVFEGEDGVGCLSQTQSCIYTRIHF